MGRLGKVVGLGFVERMEEFNSAIALSCGLWLDDYVLERGEVLIFTASVSLSATLTDPIIPIRRERRG